MAGSDPRGKPAEGRPMESPQGAPSAVRNRGQHAAGTPVLRIGTRGSPLALAQAEEVKTRLIAAHPALAGPDAIAIVVIKTTGDQVQDRPLAEIGGKGLFTKEIEEALLDGGIDLAVHSMKDVPTYLPDGLEIACLLPREDPRDVLISASGLKLADLPQGTVVGTASLRRQAQLKASRPDLVIVPLRGNVGTRIAKIERGDAAATLLALAGLKRLGKAGVATEILAVDQMLPAAAQGAIGIEIRGADQVTRDYLAPLHDAATAICVAAERACLARLEGSCRTPIAIYAELQGGDVHLRSLIATVDGSLVLRDDRRGAATKAAEIGTAAADALLEQQAKAAASISNT
jgi:hydroxymethylbilane synthase